MSYVYATPDREHVVYSFYDADDFLLYVGCTADPERRFGQHKSSKTWWPEVARIEQVTHPDAASAYMAERRAILDLAPRYNRHHNTWHARCLDMERPITPEDDALLDAVLADIFKPFRDDSERRAS